ncbi:MAG: DUF192 domain-containing protein [Actinomycetes bacterium]
MRVPVPSTRAAAVAAAVLVAAAVGLAGCATGGPADAPGAGPTAGAPGTAVEVPPLHPSVDDWPATLLEVVDADGTAHPVAVRVADTDERKAHGLMEVPRVPAGAGMWFPYDGDRTGGFWMKGTETDLSIAWVDAAGVIVATADMTVCRADPCEVYEPGATYRAALEVPLGWFEARGIGVGDRVIEAPVGG